MECFMDGAYESFCNTVLVSLATQIELYMTSYPTIMVEELICCCSNSQLPESHTDYGLLTFTDATILLSSWSYLAHFPLVPKQLSSLKRSMSDKELPPINMCTSSKYALGPQTTVDASLCMESQ